MDLFQETDYRKIVQTLIRALPKLGHGQVTKLATHLGVNTTLVSQVLSGSRDFTEEQAYAAALFFEMNPKESYYFVLLVQTSRAASEPLKELLTQQIRKLQMEAQSVKGRVEAKKELNFEQQAVYYSQWIYAAIHTLVSIEEFQTADKIARKLKLDPNLTTQIVDRLLEYGLLAEKKKSLSLGAASTYVAPDSPHVVRHHQNWRQVSSQQMLQMNPDDFFFTAPFSISKKDMQALRLEMTQVISRLYKSVENTRPEELACLNLDLFRVT